MTVDIMNENEVKQFFNSNEINGFQCSQMGKNSCHMIEWSTSQWCYFNGVACINVNFQNYQNFKIFTLQPAILNRYACLAIEASLTFFNVDKYFEYDEINRRCISKQYVQFPPQFDRCEDVMGNSNICLRFTKDHYCKWDKISLKCVTVTQDEFADMATCDQNQNIKACKENIHAACFFSLDQDKCIPAVTYVPCDYFDQKGPVTEKACQQIDLPQQQCEWSDYKCITSNKSSELCDVIGSNKFIVKIACRIQNTYINKNKNILFSIHVIKIRKESADGVKKLLLVMKFLKSSKSQNQGVMIIQTNLYVNQYQISMHMG